MEEKWKDIEGYEGIYQVSNLGNVRSLYFKNNKYKIDRIKERSKTLDKKGYLRVILCKDGKIKNFQVHRLVAQAFIPNPNNYNEVNHKDENPSNNRVDNLEWCTHKYNMNYGSIREKINKKKRKKIIQYDLNGNFIKKWESIIDIERMLNISSQCIFYACKNKTKNTKGYIWRYVDE